MPPHKPPLRCLVTPSPTLPPLLHREPAEKLPIATRALDAARQRGDRHQQGHALLFIGDIHLGRGDLRSGIAHIEQALPLLKEAGDRNAMEDAHLRLALAFPHASDWGQAAVHHEALFDIWAQEDLSDEVNAVAVSKSLLWAAAFHGSAGEEERALRLHERGAPVLERAGISDCLLLAQLSRGELFCRLGEHAQAEALLRAGVARAQELGRGDLGRLGLMVLYLLLRDRNDHRRAAEAAEQLLRSARAEGVMEQVVWSLSVVGRERYCLGQYAEAIRCWLEAASLADQGYHPPDEAALLTRLGQLLIFHSGLPCLQGPERAIPHLQRGIDLARADGDAETGAWAHCMMGSACFGLRRPEAADHYRAALALARETGVRDHEALALCGLARIADRAEDTPTARRLHGQIAMLAIEAGFPDYDLEWAWHARRAGLTA